MSLVERAKNIVLKPKDEWKVIDTETATTGGLYTGYIVPLAAIGPVAAWIGWSVFGIMGFRMPLTAGLKTAIIQYVASLISVFILALIIDALAPTFGGQKNRTQALKVAAYSSTAAWVAGIFAIVPALSILGILALYSLYLLYLGLPALMKSPQEKAMGYTAVVVICAVLLFFVAGAITARFMVGPAMFPGR